MTSKLESALALARKGFRVFPLHPNSKIPAINDFPNAATTDEAKIRAWWHDPVQKCESNHNIGIATGRGLVVIDLDVKEDQNGLETFKDIDFLDECADTYRVRTPSGGLHLYFHAEGTFRNSVRLLGPGGAAGARLLPGQRAVHRPGAAVAPVVRIEIGDALELLEYEPSVSIQCCVTSPPYFGLRDYGMPGQMGLEETPDRYVAAMVGVFREVRRVLRDDGTLWLNLGDSYARSPGKGLHKPGDAGKQTYLIERGGGRCANTLETGLADKQLVGIPWRVAFALQADGWYLRQDIIWHKPNPMPESVRDRCTKAHEYLFMFSKQPKYFYDSDAIKEPSVTNDTRRPYAPGQVDARGDGHARGGGKQRGHGQRRAGFNERYAAGEPPETRNRRSVWTIPPKPFKGAHFATFPPDLVEPCILAGTKPGDTVLDPFGGSGTTGMVAKALGRDALLIELNPAYAEMARSRIG